MNLAHKIVPIRVTTHMALRAVCFLAVLCIHCGSGHEVLAATRSIEYLYVEANEGDSSGGHTAIRFENQTFHFQNNPTGIIRIRRLDSADFDHIYAMLGNRTIRESSIAVSDETYTSLRDGFFQFTVIQDAQLDILETLHRDVQLFELLLKQAKERSGAADTYDLPLKGLGYFLTGAVMHPAVTASSDSGTTQTSPILIKLRDRIRATYGERFTEEQITQARFALRKIELRASLPPAVGISRETYPLLAASPSAIYEDAQLALLALELLQSAPKLVPDTFWSSPSDPFALTSEEMLLLANFEERLTGDLVRLVRSSRSDWGFPFIAGMARLAAIEASLSSGRLVLLDIFPDDVRIQQRHTTSGQSYLPAMRNETEKAFRQRRKEFFGHREVHESDYAALERVGNQFIELEQAMQNGVQPRRIPETPLPSRQTRRYNMVLPDMDEATLKRELEIARNTENDYAGTLTSLYSYDLIRRNCVTEIFTLINSIFGRLPLTTDDTGQTVAHDPAQKSREESLQRLGGFVDASRGLTFIPFVSAGEVDSSYSVTARHEIPSYRAKQLAEMKKRESPFLVFLRESNTITSTIYRRAPGDSPFLFFTDDTVLLRPLFGTFNLLAGLGESLLGLATMPVEGTQQLTRGMKGVLFSLPELAFVNIRKGSMEYVEESR